MLPTPRVVFLRPRAHAQRCELWVMALPHFRTSGLKMEVDYETIREGPWEVRLDQ